MDEMMIFRLATETKPGFMQVTVLRDRYAGPGLAT